MRAVLSRGGAAGSIRAIHYPARPWRCRRSTSWTRTIRASPTTATSRSAGSTRGVGSSPRASGWCGGWSTAGCAVQSVLLTAPRLATLGDALGGRVPGLPGAAGGARSRWPDFTSTAAAWRSARSRARPQIPRGARTLVVLEDLTDVDNLGAIARHAAAFGADALVLSPRCADPFYRKAIRVSLGAVFTAADRPTRRAGPRICRRCAPEGSRWSARCSTPTPRRSPLRPPAAGRAAVRRRGARSLAGRARRLRSPGDHPDVARRRFPQRRHRGGAISLRLRCRARASARSTRGAALQGRRPAWTS